MSELKRRDFIKSLGLGVGAAMTTKLWTAGLKAQPAAWNAGNFIADKFMVSPEDIKKILNAALSKGGDFADIYFEYKIANGLTIEEGIVKSSSESIILGAGIRTLKGNQTGYAFTNELTLDKLINTALTSAAIAGDNKAKISSADLRQANNLINAYKVSAPITNLPLTDKITILREAYDASVNHDKKITKVMASLGDEMQFIALANSEGLIAYDERPQLRLTVVATAEDNKIRNTGTFNAGGRYGADFFKTQIKPAEIGKKASEEALILLTAKNPPPGEQVVVLSKDQSGVMIHEAVGHPLEADSNWKKASIMWDKLNQQVANPIVTIYDDATISNYRGSLNIDDEGTPTESVPLIEKGKLVGYLNDRLGARILGHKPNGHGRRESYRNMPIPRMNNTILAKGDHPPEEIISSVKKGFYAVTYQGGMVNDTGKFTFSVNLGYMIEDGKLSYPVKNATLIGTNLQILKEVSMVGNDMGFFLGTCGKDGQSVPVTCGTPTLKIDKMTVGGVA